MAAIVGVYGLVGQLSLAFQITLTSAGPDTQTNADLLTTSGLAALPVTTPQSPLLTFLKTIRASAAACDVAFRAIGGRIDWRQTAGTATTVPLIGWANANALPSLTYLASGGSNEAFEINLWVPFSMIQ